MMSKKIDSQSAAASSDEKPVLPKLYAISMTLHIISFLMGFVVLVVLPYRAYLIPEDHELSFGYFSSIFLTDENIFLVTVCFCGFFLEKPTHWLVDMAKGPKRFFQESAAVTGYRPLRWFFAWSTLFMLILVGSYVAAISFPDIRVYYWRFLSSLWVFYLSLIVASLAFRVIAYYRKNT